MSKVDTDRKAMAELMGWPEPVDTNVEIETAPVSSAQTPEEYRARIDIETHARKLAKMTSTERAEYDRRAAEDLAACLKNTH